jgi:hypothetical protein
MRSLLVIWVSTQVFATKLGELYLKLKIVGEFKDYKPPAVPLQSLPVEPYHF